MFKRANKVTALLVAAASIMSVVPAMAAERIGTKDGTIKQGIAYGDGQYGYYGYRTDDDNTGIWYNKGTGDKDSTNDDLENYEYNNAAKYGDKYAYATSDDDNDDEYLIDLSTGKIDDDATVEDNADSAKSSLYTTIKKADRYNGIEEIADADFTRILTGQFGDIWYEYTTDAAVYDDTSTAGVVLTQAKGSSHIDVSYTANLYVYSTYKKKVVKLEEYNKEYKDYKLTAQLHDKDSVKILAQDKENLYALVKVDVVDSNTNSTSVQYFIQKISKARGDKEDGIYTPKSVTSYQLDNKSWFDDGDVADAYKVILGSDPAAATATSVNLDSYYLNRNAYAVKDGVLYVTNFKNEDDSNTNDNKAIVYTLKLSKMKVDSTVDASADDLDTYLVKKTDDADHDITELNNVSEKGYLAEEANTIYSQSLFTTDAAVELNSAVSVDTEGNTWILDKGKILKYVDGDFKEMYTVDRAMNCLDVYDENNLIAWDSDGDAYTTVQEGKKQTVDDATVVDPTLGQTTPATVGWKQEATGWTFYDVNGTKTANYWVNDNGTWYYIKADGIMATGWAQVNGTWYFLKANGAMATGWLNDNGTWYYLASSGAMLANTTVDGYKLGASGAWIQ